LGATQFPKVSVILPARNEERYIARCLDSLLAQDYSNFEIIAINDSSTDMTGEIIKEYAARDSRVVHVNAPVKPEDWAGKNWACYEGYLQAKGELLLFTDADTEHFPMAMSLAVGQLLSQNLDALTAVPRLICNDFWTKITLPALATFLHTRFSPLRVNDPNTKTGYFFGSFFAITRSTYEAIGTHEGVRQELVEDGALGGKVKEGKFKLKMVRGERQIEAVWARDLSSLWHGLRRLMIPLYYQNRSGAYMMAAAVFFILFAPFAFLPYLPAATLASDVSFQILLGLQMATIALIIAATGVQCRLGVFESPAYAFASPLSGALISFGFLSAIADARKKGSVSWRDRQYTVSENQHPIH
jgi:glycosyltransferase involved in cell wall biosynthesis